MRQLLASSGDTVVPGVYMGEATTTTSDERRSTRVAASGASYKATLSRCVCVCAFRNNLSFGSSGGFVVMGVGKRDLFPALPKEKNLFASSSSSVPCGQWRRSQCILLDYIDRIHCSKESKVFVGFFS